MCLVLIVVIRCKGQPLTLGGGEAPSVLPKANLRFDGEGRARFGGSHRTRVCRPNEEKQKDDDMTNDLENLNDPLVEDYSEWTFTYEYPNGTVLVRNDKTSYPGNHRPDKLDLTEEDFGEYKISWVSPTGCTGSTVFTLNFPDEGCGDNGTRISDFYSIDAVYPVPATAGAKITLEISTKSGSVNSLAGKNANNTSGKTPELVSRKETIRVSLYNFDGRMVGETQTFDVEQGKVKVYYQLGNQATGNYIIKVDGDLWTDSKQITIK